jgi:NosR/NirI family nitrous oxide reductase transcriptional regulator
MAEALAGMRLALQRCANECPVQSIHPEGHINVNECIYCMHCQELYHDDHRCPHMIQVRLKREKRAAMASPASLRESKEAGGETAKTIFTHQGNPFRKRPRPTIWQILREKEGDSYG